MNFSVIISTGNIPHELQVQFLDRGLVFEKFKVFATSNPNKFIILQNNKPLIRDIYKLQQGQFTWTVVSGNTKNERNFKQIVRKIEEFLEPGKKRRLRAATLN